RRGSVGRPAPGVELRIELPDGGEAAPGADGEICVRGPMVMTGYWNAPQETAQTLRGGWLHTGDVGRLDDGYLYIVDRIKDRIIHQIPLTSVLKTDRKRLRAQLAADRTRTQR